MIKFCKMFIHSEAFSCFCLRQGRHGVTPSRVGGEGGGDFGGRDISHLFGNKMTLSMPTGSAGKAQSVAQNKLTIETRIVRYHTRAAPARPPISSKRRACQSSWLILLPPTTNPQSESMTISLSRHQNSEQVFRLLQIVEHVSLPSSTHQALLARPSQPTSQDQRHPLGARAQSQRVVYSSIVPERAR